MENYVRSSVSIFMQTMIVIYSILKTTYSIKKKCNIFSIVYERQF